MAVLWIKIRHYIALIIVPFHSIFLGKMITRGPLIILPEAAVITVALFIGTFATFFTFLLHKKPFYLVNFQSKPQHP